MPDALLDDLLEWLRIPSISTGGGTEEDLRRAAAFVCERVDAAGGEAQLLITETNPLAYGELKANRADAPTVLIYGHYDVQSIGDAAAWTSDPFAPEIRDGRVYARGASDDKGNFLPLLHAACALARAGELPVNVRVLVEGEEEAGGAAVAAWLREDEIGADVAVVFDSDMADPDTPAITVGLRGMVMAEIGVTVGARDLHSGMYGGSVLNAAHVLHGMLSQVVPGPDGVPREELRAGVAPVADAERASWARMRAGDEVIAEVGGRPVSPDAGARYYERNGADTAVEVNQIAVGEPRTIVPAHARAAVSVRLAPGQSSATIRPVLERLLRDAAPAGADVDLDVFTAEPSLFPVDSASMRLAAKAMERACGVAPVFQRSGGSIPIVADFAAKGITTVVSGFALPDDDIHAPNESYRLASLELGERASTELLKAFARL